jgi:hypothetical protein
MLNIFQIISSKEPKEISGHTSGIKKALWCSEDKQILSADDKTVRYVIFL